VRTFRRCVGLVTGSDRASLTWVVCRHSQLRGSIRYTIAAGAVAAMTCAATYLTSCCFQVAVAGDVVEPVSDIERVIERAQTVQLHESRLTTQ